MPVTVTQGSRQETIWISGYGHNGPKEVQIHFGHGGDAMTLNIGPEEQDNGAPGTPVEDDDGEGAGEETSLGNETETAST